MSMPLLCLMLLVGSGTCMAQTTIYHCTSATGTPVFTDQPCSGVDAVPAATDVTDASALAPGTPRGPRHCPLDVNDLKQRIANTFRNHDANALAGLMLWQGYGKRGAADSVEQLAQWMQWPFLGFARASVHVQPAPATSTWLPPLQPVARAAPARPARSDTLIVKLGNPVQPRVTFHLVHRDGCLWLEP